MTDDDTAKVDASARADTPKISDASNDSKINNPKIDVKIGMRKLCTVAIALS